MSAALPLWETGPGYPAVFSPCRTYRYILWRQWGSLPFLMVVGLNPSTADETADDPTLRRCIGFAKRENMGALCMTNVYAYRSTDPATLPQVGWSLAVGGENSRWLTECAKRASLIICAWGKHARQHDRETVTKILTQNNERVMCLGKNLDGTPKHPLYLPANSPLLTFGGTP